MIFSAFLTVGIIPLGICSDAVSEDTDWITSVSYTHLDVYKRQAGIWPQAAGGIPFNACEFQSKGDAITDLFEDMAAEGAIV